MNAAVLKQRHRSSFSICIFKDIPQHLFLLRVFFFITCSWALLKLGRCAGTPLKAFSQAHGHKDTELCQTAR